MLEQECGAEKNGFGEHDVGGLCRKGGHERLVLRLGGPREDMFDVERDRLDALQLCALGKAC